MPHVSSRPAERLHVVPRHPVRPSVDLSCRTVRPSLLDQRFAGDAWIVSGGQGPLTLCLGTYALVQIQGLPLDLPALNHLLERARTRRPRRFGGVRVRARRS
jgi:hypothetical protein